MTQIDPVDKRLIEELATGYIESVDGDATLHLAALYAAACVLERELLDRGHADARQLLVVQLVGKRLGAGMDVVVDEQLIWRRNTQ